MIIIDDSRLMRDGLCALLSAQPDMLVVATAADMPAGLCRIAEMWPDVVLMDAGLGGEDRNHSVEQIRMSAASPGVIVTDLFPAPEDVGAFAKLGANGFVTKDAAVEDLLTMVRSVAEEMDILAPEGMGAILSQTARDTMAVLPRAAAAVRLTAREREVTGLIGEGLANKAIALRLGVADDTVKTHVRNILEKLALHSRLEIAAHSHRVRLAEPGARPQGDAPDDGQQVASLGR